MLNTKQRNNIQILGSGKNTFMLAHGFGCDQHVWQKMIEGLMELDATLILFDHTGSGNSDLLAYSSDKYKTLAGYAQDVLEICRELQLSDIIFIGHSVSSTIGVLAANEAPEFFKRIIMIGPSPRYINDVNYVGGFEKEDIDGLIKTMSANYLGWAIGMAPLIMGNKEMPELSNALEKNFCSTDPVIAKEFAAATFYADNRKDYNRLKVPSLTLQCQDDMIAPIQVGEYIEANTPLTTLRVLNAKGHCPHMSAPDETLAAIKTYLKF
jgi:sigma-B regulation protein RsbQ